ncbi:MAG TPA: glycosyltransferase family 39 protein, partial [Candidatus Aminicenantes bacterium]|nr:glycosyltransferase family 39 protein [Candidatus Aminicenantes bacterium]
MNGEATVDRLGFWRDGNGVLLVLALTKLAIHLGTNLSGGYGYFRDEFYYIACAQHMAWGYVDQPPLSIALLWLNQHLFGDSLFALRLLPALAGAATVLLAGLIARRLGGGRFAQALAALATIVAPQLLGTNSVFSMNSFDILLWTLAFYLLIGLTECDDRKTWILLGLVLGLGLLNKVSVFWLGAGLFAGLLLTEHRRRLLTRNAWICAGIALLLFLPHLLWQVANRFPTLEFIHNASTGKYVAVSPLTLFQEQVLNMNPLTALFWIPGLVTFLVAKPTRRFRILPVVYLAVFAILALNGTSKPEYLGPAYPLLFALGAVALDAFLLRRRWHWPRPILFVLLSFSGVALAPFAIPVLPVEHYIAYAQRLGMAPSTAEKKVLSKLPQNYADMFGWERMVAAFAAAYAKLTPAEKTRCALMGDDYGQAGAIDFLGGKHGL